MVSLHRGFPRDLNHGLGICCDLICAYKKESYLLENGSFNRSAGRKQRNSKSLQKVGEVG
jgi:hypothetical protein